MIFYENQLPAISCLICYLLKKQQNLKLSSAANYRWRIYLFSPTRLIISIKQEEYLCKIHHIYRILTKTSNANAGVYSVDRGINFDMSPSTSTFRVGEQRRFWRVCAFPSMLDNTVIPKIPCAISNDMANGHAFAHNPPFQKHFQKK